MCVYKRFQLLCEANFSEVIKLRTTNHLHLNLLSDVGPADIDVVAAIGDYLVAGTAALANNTGDTFKDFPEVSFAMGKFFSERFK